jgi:hypothetical protein
VPRFDLVEDLLSTSNDDEHGYNPVIGEPDLAG